MAVMVDGTRAAAGGVTAVAAGDGTAALRGGDELSDLYRALSDRLVHIVRRDVRAPEPLIEDACQFAWTRFVAHHRRVRRDATLSWLATTAVREAFKLIGRDGRELSLDAAREQGFEPGGGLQPDLVAEQHARLALIGALPERQRRLVWLHALGLTYGEIAAHAGCSERTVERQLLRAKRALREADRPG
jgi:RNA polymerase sigma factor (sigma-70 family)